MMLKQNFNRRHSPNRRRTRVEALLHLDDRAIRIVILDVSYDGMKLSVPENIEPGSAVTIEIGTTRIPAIVHWCRMRTAGCHLLERLDSETLKSLETAYDEFADYR